MKTISQLKFDKGECINKMKRLLDQADEEHRAMTDVEEERYKSLDAMVDQIDRDIASQEGHGERRAKLNEAGRELSRVVNPLPGHARPGGDRSAEGDTGGFSNLAEFFWALGAFKKDGRQDERLTRCYERGEQRIQAMGAGTLGGFLLPDQFDSTLRMVEPQSAIVRPRSTVIPPGNVPDAALSFPALSQVAADNMYGGIVITHTGEAVPMIETFAKFREVTLQPKEISAFLCVTNKLLLNFESAGAIIMGLLRRAIIGCEDYDMLRGDGLNKCQGVLNADAAININRSAPNTISYTDVTNMLSRVLMRNASMVWAASQSIIPQLSAMTAPSPWPVWTGGAMNTPGAASALPSTLFGFPLMFSERLPALGTKGDLSLLSLSEYVIKDGSGPIAASSDQIFFTSNLTVFKVVWSVDGKSWLSEPIQLEGAPGSTVSPFVVLN